LPSACQGRAAGGASRPSAQRHHRRSSVHVRRHSRRRVSARRGGGRPEASRSCWFVSDGRRKRRGAGQSSQYPAFRAGLSKAGRNKRPAFQARQTRRPRKPPPQVASILSPQENGHPTTGVGDRRQVPIGRTLNPATGGQRLSCAGHPSLCRLGIKRRIVSFGWRLKLQRNNQASRVPLFKASVKAVAPGQ
jgi:hypothetical protein